MARRCRLPFNYQGAMFVGRPIRKRCAVDSFDDSHECNSVTSASSRLGIGVGGLPADERNFVLFQKARRFPNEQEVYRSPLG
jgi:hypothetical protein